MKKHYLLFTCLPLSLFSYEVEFEKRFVKELKPDTLSTQIEITTKSNSIITVSKILNRFSKEIKSNNDVDIYFKNYLVYPLYKKDTNNLPKIISYLGKLQYKVSSNSASSLNSFIYSINQLKEKRQTSVELSSLSWKIKKSSEESAYELLRFQAIKWGNTYAKNLSVSLNTQCKIKAIKIKLNSNKADSSFTSFDKHDGFILPTFALENLALDALYSLDCK